MYLARFRKSFICGEGRLRWTVIGTVPDLLHRSTDTFNVMKLKVLCPECQSSLIISSELAGKRIKCTVCEHIFAVQAVQTPSEQSIKTGTPIKREASTQSVSKSQPSASKKAAAEDTIASRSQTTKRSERDDRSGTRSSPSKEKGRPKTGLPKTIGRFIVRDQLGVGGFGNVYKAHDPILDRFVALKVMHPSDTSAEDSSDRVLREAKASAKLRHPNIVSVFEVGDIDSSPFIASQYVAGDTLSVRIKEHSGPVTDQQSLRQFVVWIVELSRALAYSHREGIIHRDVKPHNVLIDDQSHAQLTDFGLAHNNVTKATDQRQLIGTPAYMSPEQVRGDLSEVNSAADQYGVGVILFEVLAGRRPFEGDSHALLSSVLHDDLPKPSAIAPGVPQPLEQICLKSLSRDAADRYADCDALADDLERWLDGELVLAGNPGWVDHSLHWAKKRPHMAGWIAATVAILMLLGGTTATLGWRRANDSRVIADQQTARLDQTRVELQLVSTEKTIREKELATLVLREKVIEQVRLIDGGVKALRDDNLARLHRTLDRVPWDERGIEHSLLRRRAMGAPFVLHAGQPVRSLSWSGDGSLLMALTANSKLAFWDGQAFTPLTTFELPRLACARFHPEKMQVVTLQQGLVPKGQRRHKASIRIWAVKKTGKGVLLTPVNQSPSEMPWLNAIAFHPDGDEFAVCGNNGVEIWEFAEAEITRRSKPSKITSNVLDLAYASDGSRLDCLVSSSPKLPCQLFSVSPMAPDGEEIESPGFFFHDDPAAKGWGSADTVVSSLDESDLTQSIPESKYFEGKVLCIGNRPVGNVNGDGPSCAIETSMGRLVVGFADGHVENDLIKRSGHMAAVTSVSMRSDRGCVATGDESGDIRIWPTSSRTPEGAELRCPPQGRLREFGRVVVNGEGTLVSASTSPSNPLVTLWNPLTGKVEHELAGHVLGAAGVSFHPARQEIATVDGSGLVRIWNLSNEKQGTKVTARWSIEDVMIDSAAFLGGGESMLVTGMRFEKTDAPTSAADDEGFVAIVNSMDGTVLREIPVSSWVTDACEVPGGIVIAQVDASVGLYSPDTGDRIAEFETDGLIAIDVDATSTKLIAALAEPCVEDAWLRNLPFQSQLRCWSLNDQETLYDVAETGVAYSYVDIDEELGRVLTPVADGYQIHDAETGERLWLDDRYPASAARQGPWEESYTVAVPTQRTQEQTYTVCVPYTEEVRQTVEEQIAYIETELIAARQLAEERDTLRTDQLDSKEAARVTKIDTADGVRLISQDVMDAGVYMRRDQQGLIRFYSDKAMKEPVSLKTFDEPQSLVVLTIAFESLRTVRKTKTVPVTKTRVETRTRQISRTHWVAETRTRTVNKLAASQIPFAKMPAIFLPHGAGVAIGSDVGVYVVSAEIPSEPKELVGSECLYQMVATSSDGALVAAAGKNLSCGTCGCNRIDIWDTATGELVNTIPLDDSSAGDIAFDPTTGNLMVGIACVGGPTLLAEAAPMPAAPAPGVIPPPPVGAAPPAPVPVAQSQLANPDAQPADADAADEAEVDRLLVFDPRTGQRVATLDGIGPVVRIATSRQPDSATIVVDDQGQCYVLQSSDNAIKATRIKSADPNDVSISPDGQLIVFEHQSGRTAIASIHNPLDKTYLPKEWTHAHFSVDGQSLVAIQENADGEPLSERGKHHQQVLAVAWSTKEIAAMLSGGQTPHELPVKVAASQNWVLPGLITTAVAGSDDVFPLHNHGALDRFLRGQPSDQPRVSEGRVFCIANAHVYQQGNEWRPLPVNHVVVWDHNARRDERRDSLPLRNAGMLKRLAVSACGPPPSTESDPASETNSVSVTNLRGNLEVISPDTVLVYAEPGENFTIDFTVHHETSVPTKFAANIRLNSTSLYSEKTKEWLRNNHSITQHFDTQSRPGYTAVGGEGELKFRLVGVMPEATGVFRVPGDIGLFDKKNWSTKVQHPLDFLLVTDKQLWGKQHAWRAKKDAKTVLPSEEPQHVAPVPAKVDRPAAPVPVPVPQPR